MSESEKPRKAKKLNKQVPHRLFSKDAKKPGKPSTKQASKSIKKSDIRSLKRLLSKPDLPEAIKQSKALELKILEDRFQSTSQASKQAKIDARYKYIKFVERQKIQRKLNTITKQLAKTTSSDRGQTDEEKSLRAQLEALQKDLDYIDFYPKGVKYISLFPSKTFNSTVSNDQSKDMSDDESDNANESNSDSDAEMKSGSNSTDESNSHSASETKLTREEIRNLVAKAKSRVVKNDKKAEIAHSNAGKKKEKKRKEFKDPFFLHSDDEQDTNQSSLSDKKINKQSNTQSNSQSNKQASKPKLDDPFLSLADDNEQSTTQATEERPVYTSRKDRRAAERNQSITQSTIPAAKPETKPVDIKALSSVDKQALNREADRQRKRPRDDQSSDKQSNDQPKPKRFVIDPTNQSINQSNEQSSERPERTGDRAARRAERARQHALKKESGQTNSESAKPVKIHSTPSVQTNDQVSAQPLSRKDRRRLASEQPAAESHVKSNEQPITQSNSQPSEPERETRKQKRARLAKDPSATDAPSNESTSQSNQSKVDVGSLLQLNEDSD